MSTLPPCSRPSHGVKPQIPEARPSSTHLCPRYRFCQTTQRLRRYPVPFFIKHPILFFSLNVLFYLKCVCGGVSVWGWLQVSAGCQGVEKRVSGSCSWSYRQLWDLWLEGEGCCKESKHSDWLCHSSSPVPALALAPSVPLPKTWCTYWCLCF